MYKSFNVKTLGILEINYSKNVFPEQGKRSRQVELLIIYLIFQKQIIKGIALTGIKG